MVKALLPKLATYSDILMEGRTFQVDVQLLEAMVFHIASHILHARNVVLKHNARLKAKKLNQAQGYIGTNRDQGFVRPRVLILCPFRGVALRVIKQLVSTFGENTTVGNMEKLEEEYGSPSFADDRHDKTANRRQENKGAFPDDWKADFQQNVDDDFKIGIQVNPGKGKGNGASKGVYLRLFSDFYISDVIIASPLGLRFVMEDTQADNNKTDAGGMQTQKGSTADFLSSLEVVLVHQADVMLMQNWNHVNFIFEHMNMMPTYSHDTDFSRVRPYFLDSEGANHRQIIVTSHFLDANINSTFRRFGHSHAGKLTFRYNWAGCLGAVRNHLRQLFQRIPFTDDALQENDCRWEYFRDHVLMPILRTGQTRTLIVAPSYIHYIKIRNELLRLEANAAFICEYSRDSEISRGRSRFYHGRHDILVYSGRCHFFRRPPSHSHAIFPPPFLT
eukprot:GSChrysophyteH1.ASY1.ANO1.3124.1 assembled CDS